jgi:Tol biopolymer transport system component
MKVPSEQEPAQEWTVEENASNSQFVAWSPDGHNLLFTSDRSGSWDLWRLPIENGKAKSEAVLVRRAFGQIQPMGMTSQGGLYYWTTNFASDVYTAAIEPETGKLLREPKLASERYVGSNCCATWSPDGKYLAFRSQPGAGQGQAQPVIVTLDLATGKRHETYVQWPNFRTPKWSPDGKEFLITTNLVINRVNSETGEVTPVVKNTGESTLLWSQWTPDGKSIIYSNRTTLFVRDVASGIDREIYRRPGAGEPMIFNPTISSDGRSIAFLRGGDLCLIPVAGGEPRVLHQAEPLSIVREGGMAWTPDSKMLLVVRAIRKNPASWERTSELWRIPVDGGEPAKTELSTPGMTDISLNADGKTLAFSASQRWGEVWVLENFLPKLSAAR